MENEDGSSEEKARKLLPEEGINRLKSEGFPPPMLRPATKNLTLLFV